ncbi:hypothetical protein PR202_ga03138 [Eleusine coracana subsp. coracana]|uniref:Uncharacterized protein n=1 Tax=Eleusine coracana subsp. coracana TaxID=191504 RepID=A0AAV5BML4_ELECO|nr:hypothetical protein PR202_ga03138 [Eleusine coracana subsp. coracana]
MAVESHGAISAGDAFRVMYDRGVVSYIMIRMEMLLKFEEICQEITKEFSPTFAKILPFLCGEIASEDAILRCAEEKEYADKSNKLFLKQPEAFIQNQS